MKLFLLQVRDEDCVLNYGVFSSREIAQSHKDADKFSMISCADIVELDLDKCDGPVDVYVDVNDLNDPAKQDSYCKLLQRRIAENMASSPYADLLKMTGA